MITCRYTNLNYDGHRNSIRLKWPNRSISLEILMAINPRTSGPRYSFETNLGLRGYE